MCVCDRIGQPKDEGPRKGCNQGSGTPMLNERKTGDVSKMEND